ncbi:MAG: hypothetical protein ING16_18660 [Roseomonas sp.]|nr:hypothetical protein [Roseomonas sp.]
MLRRRTVLGAALLPVLTDPARATPPDLAFAVIREGRQIGTHLVRFRQEGELLRARSEVRITVRIAGFTVYRYTHDTEEAWRGNRLVALDSRLDRNGHKGACEARAEGNGLRLRSTAGEWLMPINAAPLTWWRAASLLADLPLFDPEEGRPVEPRLERRAEGGGQRVTLVGGEGAEVLYNASDHWVGFSTTGEDGIPVTYRPA